jgi:DtxR family Mn-dependent transcriptional regulator
MSDSYLSESLEDYLIAIADLAWRANDSADQQAGDPREVHSTAVADRVGVSTASVTHAFRALRERGLIEYERYQAVRLTDRGFEVARQVIGRKRTLLRFFGETLGLDPDEAERNAHRMEHVITQRAVERLERLVESIGRGGAVSRGKLGRTDR